jgi:hypothetical protein
LIARLTSKGETLTMTLLVTVTIADAVAVPAKAWIVTGLVDGRSAGAVYSAVFPPVGTTIPVAALPPATPFTSQAIVTPDARQIDVVKVCDPPSATVAAEGEIVFVLEHEIVTIAFPAFELSATLVAATLTVAGVGGVAGAVYSAVSALLDVTAPNLELPPAIPFTLHVTPIAGSPVPVTFAAKGCVPPVETVAEAGDTLTTMLSSRFTVAEAVARASAWLAAATVTLAGFGRIAGAA